MASLVCMPPKNIGRLSHLIRLNFDDNRLGTRKTGDLNFLASLVNCSALEVFGLADNSSNGIHGSIPIGIKNLANLAVQGLGENNLSGFVPHTIGTLQMLNGLELNGNKFSGAIPSSIVNMQVYLDLSHNALIGSVPVEVGKFLNFLLSSKCLSISIFLTMASREKKVGRNRIFKNATSFSMYGNIKFCGGVQELDLHACTIKKASSFRKFHDPKNMEWVASLQHWKIVTVMGYYYLRFSQEKDQQMKHLKVSACMGIYHFTALALPNHVMEIIDPLLLPKQEFDDRDEEFSAKEKAMLRENEPEVIECCK
ncbi:hypothetical protein JHK86_018624 [Glycine max]|nr:hypothetical protein JHK86_018624 [Glycine max]